ncbi:hypothetical protein [Wolbachia endosymbiont (group B) of Phalera bucephala]|uniref:hypothetical protein n=1 Tax=Wolbachia endosymbiont (group B) of Phalera bucephala TaxID=2954043 RepID=UPI0022311CBD|nr:hypothetical protein [Wolbachia endosymbiont (group B) of Phalera bucephala]
MLDCTDTSKLINNKKGHRIGFVLLSLLTKLHLECLKKIQSGDRSNFPEQEEKVLFDRIESEVKRLRGSLVQLDAEHLKLIELALIDYKSLGDITLNKQHLVEFLVSSYKAISETISKKETPQEPSDKKELEKVELLRKWKEIIKQFNKDKEIKVNLDHTILDKVNKYLDVRRDAESLYKVYSTIDSCKKYLEGKGSIEVKRLILQTVLQKVGEYLKSTLDTPNLSDKTIQSLEQDKIPVKLLTNFRDRIVHYQVFPLQIDSRDIIPLLGDVLDPIKKIVQGKITEIEGGFIRGLVGKNAPDIKDNNLKEAMKSYANRGVVDLIRYIEGIKDRSRYLLLSEC